MSREGILLHLPYMHNVHFPLSVIASTYMQHFMISSIPFTLHILKRYFLVFVVVLIFVMPRRIID